MGKVFSWLSPFTEAATKEKSRWFPSDLLLMDVRQVPLSTTVFLELHRETVSQRWL